MRLSLTLFGDTSKSGSHGSAGSPNVSGNQYKADKKYWSEIALEDVESGVYKLLRDLEASAGGELGKETVSARFNPASPIGKVLADIQRSGGTDDYFVSRTGVFNANRAGWMAFSALMKFRLKRIGRWW